MIKRILSVIPKRSILPLLAMVVWNAIVYNGSRLIAGGFHHYNMELPVDSLFPFLPWTVTIYCVCFAFWAVNYIWASRQAPQETARFFSAELLAKTVCFICFIFLPTTNIRPQVGSNGFWNAIMRLLYRIDAADNLFPSIHCLESWFCFIGVRKNPEVPLWQERHTSDIWMQLHTFHIPVPSLYRSGFSAPPPFVSW